MWRPAPYTYLDQSSAAALDTHSRPPPTSAFHVTQESARDHQQLCPDSTAASQNHMGHSPEHMYAAEQLPGRHEADYWHDQPAQETVSCHRTHSLPQQQHGQRQQETRHGSTSQGAPTTGSSSRRSSRSRWQWSRHVWGSQAGSRPAAGETARPGRQQHRDSASQREVLCNVKAVVPYLSDEVILAELECTLDANQAVENLLSRM